MEVDMDDDGTFGDAFKLSNLDFGDPSLMGGFFTFKANNAATNSETANPGSLVEFATFNPASADNFDGITSLGIDLAAEATGIMLDNIRVVNLTTPACNQKVHLKRSGSLVNSFCRIQDAVNSSQDGDSIYVEAGTFTEQLTITKGIVLQGAGREQTIIESPDANQLAVNGQNWKNMKDQDVFDIIGIKTTNDKPVTIKDLKIDGRDQGFIPYTQYVDNKGLYDFHGIGAYNTTVTVENVYVTGIRNLASQFGSNQENNSNTVPGGYEPADQPAGINHNDAIFAESAAGQSQHVFTLKNSYITKFQKTAVLAWGPTLTVDIQDNIIQGYGKTLWSTGNGIQIASSDRSSYGGANGDRRGTKGIIKNNQILDIGLVIPEPGQPGSYLNLGLYSPSCILLWEAGDDFQILNNTITRTIKTKSWHNDFTSTDGGFGSTGIDVGSTRNVTISGNTINGFDEAIAVENVTATIPSIIAYNNTVTDNTMDYMLTPGPHKIILNNNSNEVVTYYHNSVGNDTIVNFGPGDKIRLVNLATGVVNGLLNGSPSMNYTNGTVAEGNGSNVAAYSVQLERTDSQTRIYLDTDGSEGAAEMKLILDGAYSPANFKLTGDLVEFLSSAPIVSPVVVSDLSTTSVTLSGEIAANGGFAVNEQGIVYSTSKNIPLIGEDGVTKVAIASQTNTFSQSITGLKSNTTYYVRTYAINAIDTSYGEVKSFVTLCDKKIHITRAGGATADYCTIQDAINDAQDGDIINIEAGTFTEQLRITKAITLQGAGNNLTIIQSPAANELAIRGGYLKTLKDQDMIAVIGVKTNSSKIVNIKDLTVDGMNQGYMPDAIYPDKTQYAFVGIGAINSNLVVDNVKVTRIRALATDYSGGTLPAGYLPADQPSGMNHNDGIFAESSLNAGEHTFEVKNCYIDKFQKDAILAWGPTLTVNIHDNTIQGYGQTLWSTGNGIQIASSDRTASGGSNGDRRGTKGMIRNNNILDIGLVIPKPGQEGSYLNLGLLSPSAILLWEAGDNFEISGNTITRSITTKSWHVDYTSADGGYGSMGIGIVSSEGTLIKNNEISGFDEAITAEAYLTQPSLVIRHNIVSNNTIDYGLLSGPNTIELGSDPEVITYYSDSPANDVISNFEHGDAIQVVKLSEGVVNGLLNGKPSVDFTNGTVAVGDGSNVAPYSIQVEQVGTETNLYIDTDGQADQAELKVTLKGSYLPDNFYLSKSKIFFQYAVAALSTDDAADITTTSAALGGAITADGGATVFERGIVYSSSNHNPAIGAEASTRVMIDSDEDTFAETVTGLAPNTTYYVRAYARNSVGLGYGEVKTFKTLDDGTTGTINESAGKVVLKAAPGLLKIFNIPAGQTVQVFDGLGKIVYTIEYQNQDIEIALPQRGIYVVKTGAITGKVVIP
jgi:hypothetical protein